ncbi:DUF5130 family protein [Sciscionella sediminilitoris]|uniref:DUF5130 family protein n=1 Tax=Sciscionella sediminilitoris TaxID=1445613 RepID=UPI0004DF2560|nr:DUF5130 family protein [Sciscionella sp. SE31]
MATGEVVASGGTASLERPADLPENLAFGAAEMPGGRISTALEHATPTPSTPFSTRELSRLDEALTLSSRETGLVFSVYLGELGEDKRARAQELHAETDNPARSVLIALSPGQRAVEIVTGGGAREQLTDRSCKLAVMSMVASFKEGDLVGGLVSGLRMLTEQAGG